MLQQLEDAGHRQPVHGQAHGLRVSLVTHDLDQLLQIDYSLLRVLKKIACKRSNCHFLLCYNFFSFRIKFNNRNCIFACDFIKSVMTSTVIIVLNSSTVTIFFPSFIQIVVFFFNFLDPLFHTRFGFDR